MVLRLLKIEEDSHRAVIDSDTTSNRVDAPIGELFRCPGPSYECIEDQCDEPQPQRQEHVGDEDNFYPPEKFGARTSGRCSQIEVAHVQAQSIMKTDTTPLCRDPAITPRNEHLKSLVMSLVALESELVVEDELFSGKGQLALRQSRERLVSEVRRYRLVQDVFRRREQELKRH